MVMNNNYLVILAAHVDSENKKIETIKTLKHLKELNIDVCLSTHSGLYLDEMSQYVKFVIYDNNNEFLKLQDYIDNSKYIDGVTKYGGFHLHSKTIHSFGHVWINIPGALHSKCALSLLRNGIILSEINNYKWTIYLEYDIKIPKLGFKHFFESHIDSLVFSGKKCLYYETKSGDVNFLWGGPFIFETQPFFRNEKFMKNDWYSNNENWIKEWYAGFFESIIEYTINNVFDENEIILKIIQDNYKEFWDVDDLSKIGKFKYAESLYSENRYLREKLVIHLFPDIDIIGNKKLYLYYYNNGEITVNLNKILVYSDNILLFNKKNDSIPPYSWFLIPIEIEKLEDSDNIILSWEASVKNEHYTHSETLKVGNFDHIHKNVMRISFD